MCCPVDSHNIAEPGLYSLSVLVVKVLLSLVLVGCLTACTDVHTLPSKDRYTKNVEIKLEDWHIIGLWVLNCPSAWIRVVNKNSVPIKNITIRYKTYGYKKEVLDTGICTIEQRVEAGCTKNFTEQALGLVNLESDMLSIELIKVERDK